MFLDAFGKLTTCRQIGMGEGPIPWTAVEEYGRAQGMDREELEELHYMMRALDSEYLAYRREREEQRSKKPKR